MKLSTTGSKHKWKIATTVVVSVSLVIIVDAVVTWRTMLQYSTIDQLTNLFYNKVSEAQNAMHPLAHTEGSNEVTSENAPIVRNRDDCLTSLVLAGLDKSEVTHPLQMPREFRPTAVCIYDLEQLLRSSGYLIEWQEWGTRRSWWYPRRWTLEINTEKQKHRLWGFGIDGSVYATNIGTVVSDTIVQEFKRPLKDYDRVYRVQLTCPESLRGKVIWSVFESNALWQTHSYDEHGKLIRSVGWFSDRKQADCAELLLWGTDEKVHRVSKGTLHTYK